MAFVTLIFPPQWSPFQPPLSLPSLRAWLDKSGHKTLCFDLNIEFYHWILSDKFVESVPKDIKEKHKDFFTIYPYLCDKYLRPFSKNTEKSYSEIGNIYTSISGISSLLSFLSEEILKTTISLYEFSVGEDYKLADIEEFINDPPWWASNYIEEKLNSISECIQETGVVGISCIGQEQLPFTLLISKYIKQYIGKSVVVGGTIFSRLIDKGEMPGHWVESYFDCIVLNEGEIPLQRICESLDDGNIIDFSIIPGVAYFSKSNQELITTNHPPPLKSNNIPVPNFDGMPLYKYLSSEVTLPILASRGCYWGKCEFCHHGMVYQDGYSALTVQTLLSNINKLYEKYHVTNFAFNDEAIPPKILRGIGKVFPSSKLSGWAFTGLIKFEKFFIKSDWANAHDVGFKSLYVGFESASEKLLRSMKKFTPITEITRNLEEASAAGIWVHCFFFFGFPGETDEDAMETIKYIFDHTDIIGSVGVGSFALEHGAPIAKHPDLFGLKLGSAERGELDVYYKYNVNKGINSTQANEYAEIVRQKAKFLPKYFSGLWIPRELLLSILKKYSLKEIELFSIELILDGFVPGDLDIGDVTVFEKKDDCYIVAILPTMHIYKVTGKSTLFIELISNKTIPYHIVANKLGKFDAITHYSGKKLLPS